MELVSEVQKDASRTDVSFHHWHLSRKIKSTSFIQKKMKSNNSLHLQLIRGNFMIFLTSHFFLYNWIHYFGLCIQMWDSRGAEKQVYNSVFVWNCWRSWLCTPLQHDFFLLHHLIFFSKDLDLFSVLFTYTHLKFEGDWYSWVQVKSVMGRVKSAGQCIEIQR